MIKSLTCHQDCTLVDALRTINNNAKGILFAVDDENRLCGILTDGDIRRLLIQGHQLSEQIKKVMNKNFISVAQGENPAAIIEKISSRIRLLPVVDEDYRVVDYVECRGDLHVPLITPDISGNELKYLVEAFLSTWISSTGSFIDQFEKRFSAFCECDHGVAVSNGTVALHLALTALGVGNGDEVIVPDMTFAATINTVLHANAVPVIVDIERDSWCIDPAEIEKAITPRTRAIIPVHLYGQPCDMEAIMRIAARHNLFVIEDCAEAHGAIFNGKKVGSIGDVGCFSFFGNKVITTGEGGMCTTNNAALTDTLRVLRDHGMSKTKKYWHEMVGFNYRMTNLQAAIGVAQLEHIDDILRKRAEMEERYRAQPILNQFFEFQHNRLPCRDRITWLICALLKKGDRDMLIASLREKKIDTRPFFYPLSTMDIYKQFVFSNTVSREISARGISFPTNADMEDGVLEEIVRLVGECLPHA